MDAAARLEGFIDTFRPEIAALGRGTLERMRRRLPGAVQLVYDNFNALVIGFGPTERASAAPVSIALYRSCVNLFFLQGARLEDPEHVLQGRGKVVRRITLAVPMDIDAPVVSSLIDQAFARTEGWDTSRPDSVVIRAVSAKRRPRR
jgi:hypothetical protein